MTVIAVANPASGSGKATQLLTELISKAPFKIIPIHCPSAIESSQMLRAKIQSEDVTDVVAIGGDGLVHLCIQEIAQTKIKLHVIPAGTGNDFASSCGRSKIEILSTISEISKGSTSQIDLGLVTFSSGKHWFGQVLSTGFDAIVNERANRIRFIKGQMKYKIATLLVLLRFKPIQYRLVIDGENRTLDAMLVSVANGPSYGGGMLICPMADRNDGFLDVIIIKPVSKFELLRVFPKVFSGSHVSHPKIQFIRAKNISIDAETLAFADGEFISQLPINVVAVSDALVIAN